MRKFVSFSKIGQFRGVIGDVKHTAQVVRVDEDGNTVMNRTADLPTIKFKGTVKLHGTNAGVGFCKDGELWAQSRTSVITPQKDNAGFAFFVESNKDIFTKMHEDLRETLGFKDETLIIFGEWCGGNIQKGVAISGLDKMFVIFAVKVVTGGDAENYYIEDQHWSHLKNPDARIYNITDYDAFTIDIDFNDPQLSSNKMVEITEQIEKECPVGKAFGRKLDTEDNTTGEGVVWVGWNDGHRFIFKVKGEKHSETKVKTLAPVDIEKLESINEFVEYAVTENRLNHAIEQVFTTNSITPDVKLTGDFIRWIVKDIATEEVDTLAGNGLEPKDVNKNISIASRKWFMNYLNKLAGI